VAFGSLARTETISSAISTKRIFAVAAGTTAVAWKARGFVAALSEPVRKQRCVESSPGRSATGSGIDPHVWRSVWWSTVRSRAVDRRDCRRSRQRFGAHRRRGCPGDR
jgi:hypothetical protein